MEKNTTKYTIEFEKQEQKQYKYFKYNKETGYLKCLVRSVTVANYLQTNQQRINIRGFNSYVLNNSKNFAITFEARNNATLFFYFRTLNEAREALAELDKQIIGE
jgi:hypothetical protein